MRRLLVCNLLTALPLLASGWAVAENKTPDPTSLLQQADAAARDPLVSPVQRIERSVLLQMPTTDGSQSPWPSIDGSNNDPANPQENMAGMPLRRRMAAAYADGVAAMAGADRPSARQVSNLVHAQDQSRVNLRGATDFLWQWGQFIDHDMDLSDGTNPPELAAIAVSAGDPWFDPDGTGTQSIVFNRSIYDHDSGTGPDHPREQINEITGWLDASMVYGSDADRAAALRSFEGGRLATSDGQMLPFNTSGLPNAGGSGSELFLAGDVRANEQVGLAAMHTLFVREHNFWAGELALADPTLDDEGLYQRARMIVAGEIQAITYREFLPMLLGANAIAPYQGYRPEMNAHIANSFSTAGYRIGHSLLSPQLLRLNADGTEVPQGHLSLREAFFAPQRLQEAGIDPILRGLAAQHCQDLDIYVIDDVRNFLFGQPGQGGFDLPALNIQRGRDHGLPSFVEARVAMGGKRLDDFTDIGANAAVTQRLAQAYADVSQMDLWTGLLAEPHAQDGMVGPTLKHLLSEQFTALRDGDRFYYENWASPSLREQISSTRLADVIRRNTDIGDELPDLVFGVASPSNGSRRQIVPTRLWD